MSTFKIPMQSFMHVSTAPTGFLIHCGKVLESIKNLASHFLYCASKGIVFNLCSLCVIHARKMYCFFKYNANTNTSNTLFFLHTVDLYCPLFIHESP